MELLAAEGELNPLLPHTVEIIVGLIAFALLLWILARTALPQFERTYAERTDKIEGGLKRAEEAQAEAAALKQKYQDQLAGARDEAARIRDDARAEGQQIKAELRAEAEEEASRIRAQAEQQVVAQREAAQRSLRGEIGGLSAELAERILGSELADPSRRSATVDSFLSDLDGMAPAGRATAESGAR
ncbi:F0F1 ATP synthase subunit B [Pseudonocardia pini]|uniref:F0F1 ATP synthase subunit B n=1 Tax=Pseudonocardia pini TaxID=2758030 RepID=UPI0015EFEFB3|nr:F0F1 ATP synthase subunit B [Pseudonocardia pini]